VCLWLPLPARPWGYVVDASIQPHSGSRPVLLTAAAQPCPKVTRRRHRGVCAGIAKRRGISAAVVRILAVLLALLGPAVVLYLLAWLLLPDPTGRIRLESAVRQADAWSIVLLVVTVLAVLPDGIGHARYFPLGVIVVVVLVVLVVVGINKGWFRAGAQERQVGGGGSTSGSPPAKPAPPAGPPAAGEPPSEGPRNGPSR
jgi:phage shock protein PspC (stress-responsive transcriptional regulator)